MCLSNHSTGISGCTPKKLYRRIDARCPRSNTDSSRQPGSRRRCPAHPAAARHGVIVNLRNHRRHGDRRDVLQRRVGSSMNACRREWEIPRTSNICFCESPMLRPVASSQESIDSPGSGTTLTGSTVANLLLEAPTGSMAPGSRASHELVKQDCSLCQYSDTPAYFDKTSACRGGLLIFAAKDQVSRIRDARPDAVAPPDPRQAQLVATLGSAGRSARVQRANDLHVGVDALREFDRRPCIYAWSPGHRSAL